MILPQFFDFVLEPDGNGYLSLNWRQEGAEKFYDLWIPLLDFVNKKYKLIKGLYGMTSPERLPFGDVIIYDGVVFPYQMCLGKNMSEQSKQIYLAAKADGMLHERL